VLEDAQAVSDEVDPHGLWTGMMYAKFGDKPELTKAAQRHCKFIVTRDDGFSRTGGSVGQLIAVQMCD
jgi:hypothetical protein